MNVRCTAMLALVPVALVACSGNSTRAARPNRVATDLITRAQIDAGKFRNAYDAVEALHPNWFIVRNVSPSSQQPTRSDTSRMPDRSAPSTENERSAPGMNAGIQVYVDGTRVGGTQALRSIAVTTVYSIRHYNGTEAQTRFGVGHSNGVIAVSTGPDKP